MRVHLIGAAAAALLAASGTANAADVIVVGVGPTAPPTVVGPTVEIDVQAIVRVDYYSGGSFYLDGSFFGDLDIRSASGWGVRFEGGGGATFYPGFGYGYSFGVELYKAIGNLQVGMYVSPDGFNPLDITFGPTLRYETDTVEFKHEALVSFWPGANWDVRFQNDLTVTLNERVKAGGWMSFAYGTYGFDFTIEPWLRYRSDTVKWEHSTELSVWTGAWEIEIDNDLERRFSERLKLGGNLDLEIWNGGYDVDAGGRATISVTDRLDLVAYADFGFFSGFWVEAGAGLELDLGIIEAYAHAEWDPGNIGLNFGFDFEKPLGTGALRLIGGAGAWLDFGGTFEYGLNASIGLRYLIGEDDDEDEDEL